jgi:hypothetical protein
LKKKTKVVFLKKYLTYQDDISHKLIITSLMFFIFTILQYNELQASPLNTLLNI